MGKEVDRLIDGHIALRTKGITFRVLNTLNILFDFRGKNMTRITNLHISDLRARGGQQKASMVGQIGRKLKVDEVANRIYRVTVVDAF